jgi:hypothetical protein
MSQPLEAVAAELREKLEAGEPVWPLRVRTLDKLWPGWREQPGRLPADQGDDHR